VNVSVATVVRLAKALGFAGFPEFQRKLRGLFRDKLTTVSRLQQAAQGKAREEDILVKVLQQDIANITATVDQVPREDFRKFVDTLNAARRTIIVGLRSTHCLAVFMGVALEFLQRDVWVVRPGVGDMWDRLFRMRSGEVVVGISFPRYTRETVRILEYAKSRRIRTLAITDSRLSPLAPHADALLTARCTMASFMESFTAPLSLINAIVTAVSLGSKGSSLKALKRMEEFWRSREIYFEGKNGRSARRRAR
jgi:DNA-binding MurR/RpiR family transcriptional regulator